MAKHFGIKLTVQQNIMCVTEIKDDGTDVEYDMVLRMTDHPDDYGNGMCSLCFEKIKSKLIGNWEMTEAKGAWDWKTKRTYITMSDQDGAKHVFRHEFRRKNWEEVLSGTFQNIINYIKLTNNAVCVDLLDNLHKEEIMNAKSRVSSRHDYNKLLNHYFEYVHQFNLLVQQNDLWDDMSIALKKTIIATLDTLTDRIKNISIQE